MFGNIPRHVSFELKDWQMFSDNSIDSGSFTVSKINYIGEKDWFLLMPVNSEKRMIEHTSILYQKLPNGPNNQLFLFIGFWHLDLPL